MEINADESFTYKLIDKNYKSGYEEKRDCFSTVRDYVLSTGKETRICAIFGIRRTGKSTLMHQVVESLEDEQKEKSILIDCTKKTDFQDVISFIQKSMTNGKKYFFIDEVTYCEDFQCIGEILSDSFVNINDARIVITGTDSLAISLASHNVLYDRINFVPTTFTPYPEYARIMGCESMDDYIKHGTTFEKNIYDNMDSTKEYVETSIVDNLINSITKSESITTFPLELTELYNNQELKTAIEKIINKYIETLHIKSLKEAFESSGFHKALRATVSQDAKNNYQGFAIKKQIKVKDVDSFIQESLNIIDPLDIKTTITKDHLDKLEKFLLDMDILKVIPYTTSFKEQTVEEPMKMKIIAHPGMYHANLHYTLTELRNNKNWLPEVDSKRKIEFLEKAYECAAGNLMEFFILADMNEMLNRSNLVSKSDFSFLPSSGRWYVSKLTLELDKNRESDMIIFDKELKKTYLFEIKHSKEIAPHQTEHITNKDFIDYVEKNFGSVSRKVVLYNGNTNPLMTIPRISAVDFLNLVYKEKNDKDFDIEKTIDYLTSSQLKGQTFEEVGKNYITNIIELFRTSGDFKSSVEETNKIFENINDKALKAVFTGLLLTYKKEKSLNSEKSIISFIKQEYKKETSITKLFDVKTPHPGLVD